jgi:hypothetical protein
VTARGLSLPIAQWLAMNTELLPDGDGYRFALDLAEIDALLADYFTRDYWSLLENPSVNCHLVIAERSTSYLPADRERANSLTSSRVAVSLLPAGHWVHTDDLNGVVRVLSSQFGNS